MPGSNKTPDIAPGTPPVIGVIGGSGVYDIDGLENTRWEKVSSPFGEPSDELLIGELETDQGGQKMVFLPRFSTKTGVDAVHYDWLQGDRLHIEQAG